MKGLQTSWPKRNKIFHYLKHTRHIQIAMLQETHSKIGDEIKWKKEWGGEIIFSHGSSSSRGTCILFAPNVDIVIHDKLIDSNGRFIILNVTINEVKVTLANIYGPNNDDEAFFVDVFQHIDEMGNDDRIIGGDFNCVLNNDKDKKGGRANHINKNSQQLINMYVDETNLVDIWRAQHSTEKRFTYHAKYRGQYIFSRIDFFLISFGLSSLVTKSTILPSFLSDHSPVEIKINLEESERGKGFWKLNCSLLRDIEYINQIKQTIRETVEDNTNLEHGMLWEMIKLKIRGTSIKYSSRKKRSNNNLLTALTRRQQILQEKFDRAPDPEIKRDIDLVHGDIEQIIASQMKGAQVRAKLNWVNEGERPTKFFLNLEKQNYNKKQIKRIKRKNGDTISGKLNLLNELESFYKQLYTSGYKTEEPMPNFDNILSHVEVSSLLEEERNACEGYIGEGELLTALKSTKSNKSPGNDGLPAEFYKVFWKDIKQYLLNALNHSYDNKKLSITQRRGVITLLPKTDRNILELKNWRPITLLNQDYKLATKSIASRICKYLHKLIHPDQTGFIKGRYIGENIFKMLNIIEYLDGEQVDALLINIDFEKAFDNLEWDFIDYCLKRLNFGESLRGWVRTFYTDVECCVLNNGWTTSSFKLSKGARQGCPLSPYLFIICAEFLACMIRQDEEIEGISINGQTYLISQYADDTNIFIKYSEQSLRKVIYSFRRFQYISGLKVNLDKTEIVPLGPIREHYKILAEEEHLRWTTDPVKCLGVTICVNKEDLISQNYNKVAVKISKIIKLWNMHHITMFGKIVIINSFLISQLVYLMSVLPTPHSELLKEIDTKLYKFLWSNKTERISRSVLKNTLQRGGISMPDVSLKNTALKIAWVKRIALSHHLSELLYRSTRIKNIEIWKCNIHTQDVNALFCTKPSKICKDILLSWAQYSYKNPETLQDILNQFIWFNSHIKIGGKPTYNKTLYTAGIKYVHQILDDRGQILNYHNFNQKFNINVNFLNYFSIINAIPTTWKNIIKMEYGNKLNAPDYNYTINKIINAKTKICKMVYKDMENQITQPPQKVFTKWEQYFEQNLTMADWLNSFQIINSCTNLIDLRYFHFKMLHLILANNEALYRWKLIESDLCGFCEEEIETLYHTYLECEVTKRFWKDLENYLYGKLGIRIPLTKQEIILGCKGTNMELWNLIYLLGKRFVYSCRCNNIFPTITPYNLKY